MSYVDPNTELISGREYLPKKTPKLSLTRKIKNVFYEADGFSLGIKIIPTTILVVGLYFAYKKFKK